MLNNYIDVALREIENAKEDGIKEIEKFICEKIGSLYSLAIKKTSIEIKVDCYWAIVNIVTHNPEYNDIQGLDIKALSGLYKIANEIKSDNIDQAIIIFERLSELGYKDSDKLLDELVVKDNEENNVADLQIDDLNVLENQIENNNEQKGKHGESPNILFNENNKNKNQSPKLSDANSTENKENINENSSAKSPF